MKNNPNKLRQNQGLDHNNPMVLTESTLTPAQKKKITQQNAKVMATVSRPNLPRTLSVVSQGEGLSNLNKGKGPDSYKWGNSNLNNNETNLEA